NVREPVDSRGISQNLVVHFNLYRDYFNKLLNKDFNSTNTFFTVEDKEKIKEAYEKAHHIREYEINLYWSRLNYL
ncbi:hypothetical protein, partial [Buttiauxella brennerae]